MEVRLIIQCSCGCSVTLISAPKFPVKQLAGYCPKCNKGWIALKHEALEEENYEVVAIT